MPDYQYALLEPDRTSPNGSYNIVTSYEALKIHHPGDNEAAVRQGNLGMVDDDAAVVNGEIEAVRIRDGNTLVKKDLIFEDPQGRSNVPVPAPVEGYVHYLNPNDFGGVRIYSKPFGTPGAELLGQVLHLDDRTFTKKQGEFIQYGESVGIQGGTGPRGRTEYGVHAHIEAEVDSFKMYVSDIVQGRIQSGGVVAMDTLKDGKLEKGEFSDDVAKLKKALNDAGARDAEGKELTTGKHFDGRAKEAVEDYQRKNNMPVTGVADQAMLQKLGVISQQQPTPTQPVAPQPAQPLPSQATQQPPQPVAPQPTQPASPQATQQAPQPVAPQPPPQPTPQPIPAQAIQQPPTPAVPTEPARPAQPSGNRLPGGPTDFGATNVLGTLIASGEGDYGSFNRGRAGDSMNKQMDFSNMTIREIMRLQDLPIGNPDRLHAVGKYQMIAVTMEETVRELGIDPNAKFTPQLQERMFADYLIDEKRPQVNDYITGKTGGERGLVRAQIALAQEFASVADPRTGRSFHDQDSAGNSSSITAQQVADALNQMREQYQKNLKSGQSPSEAYRALSGDPTAPIVSAALADGKLSQGEKGADVEKLQKALAAAGAVDAEGKAVKPDANFGDKTKQAVEDYQRKHNLPVTGVADQKMLQDLGVIAPQQAQPAQPAQPAPVPGASQSTAQPTPTSLSSGKDEMTHPLNGGNARLKEVLNAFDSLPPGTFKNDDDRMMKAKEATAATLPRVGDRPLSMVASAMLINGTIYLGDKPEINHSAGNLSMVQLASNRTPEESTQLVNAKYPPIDRSLEAKTVAAAPDPNQTNQANPAIDPIKSPRISA
jgi:peptidoglycan hydrolase-like protein with peptidoglycan-binding domain